MEALIGMLVVLALFALMVLPAAIGIAHERRIDRQLRQAGTARDTARVTPRALAGHTPASAGPTSRRDATSQHTARAA
ncbi:hypothetical protein GCM10009535_22600 [Streptomyces thermocarboxydovorans]|uniref:Secreted protein n=1 Tax=Streptomyces thermocarboxydovorans TaxID=59298 RepID=A0ABP3SJU4_9ACTN